MLRGRRQSCSRWGRRGIVLKKSSSRLITRRIDL
jgi:hypothetical protein